MRVGTSLRVGCMHNGRTHARLYANPLMAGFAIASEADGMGNGGRAGRGTTHLARAAWTRHNHHQAGLQSPPMQSMITYWNPCEPYSCASSCVGLGLLLLRIRL